MEALKLRREPTDPASEYLAGLAPGSRACVAGRLRTVAEILCGSDSFPWETVRRGDADHVRAQLMDRYSNPETCNAHLSALRGVLRTCWTMGLVDTEGYQLASAVPVVKGSVVHKGRCLSKVEVKKILAGCGDSHAGLRNAAMLAVMVGCGLRRQEVVGLDWEDRGERGELLIRGKGNKMRTAYMPSGAGQRVSRWFRCGFGGRCDAMFPTLNPVGRMGPGNVYRIVKVVGRRVGVDFSPHDLRRTYISGLLDQGEDLSLVSQMAGHSKVTTTARYDRRPEERQREAAQRISLE